jgi:hypothetical protein
MNPMPPPTLQDIHDDIKLIQHWITGNGEPERGMLMRVDRLEQRDKSRRGLFTVVYGALATSIVTAIVNML